MDIYYRTKNITGKINNCTTEFINLKQNTKIVIFLQFSSMSNSTLNIVTQIENTYFLSILRRM